MVNSSVLLLNHNFEPITTCSAKRAVVMVWMGKAEIVEATESYVRSVSRSFVIPSIIRLLIYVKIGRRWKIQLSKQNVMRRDRHTCQYCGTKSGLMTIDHIVPRSHGGRDTWENLVCACAACNNKKGDRTPEEAGLKLSRTPKKPNYRAFLILHKDTFHQSWSAYIGFP